MLNAFRHHGLYRVAVLRVLDIKRELCSTPFGITDYIGASENSSNAQTPNLCSTPFGITDYIGRRLAEEGPDRGSAQRLSASRIISGRRRLAACRARALVLNAFRHHGLYRDRPRVVEQRLDVEVLNAFRHHGLYRDRSIRADEGGFV